MEPPVDGLLSCCICNSRLTEPILLTCFHSCCRKCADSVCSSPSRGGGSSSSKDHEGGGDASRVVCPKCGSSTLSRDLGQNAFIGAMLLPQSLPASAQPSAVQPQPVPPPPRPPSCSACPPGSNEAALPAEWRCIECDTLLCSGCLRWHKKFAKQHTTERLSAAVTSGSGGVGGEGGGSTEQGAAVCSDDAAVRLLLPRCLEHGGSTCSLFCSACGRLKCIACSEACSRAGHPLSTADGPQAASTIGEESELLARARGDIRSALSTLATWRSGVAAAANDGQSPRQPAAEAAGVASGDGSSLWSSHQADLERLQQNRQAALDVVSRMYDRAKQSLTDAYERRSKAAEAEAAAAAATGAAAAIDRAALSLRAEQVEAYAQRLLSEGTAAAILDQSARLTDCVDSLLSLRAEMEQRCSIAATAAAAAAAAAAPLPSLVRLPTGEEAERAASFLIGFNSHFVEAPRQPRVGRAGCPPQNDSEHSEDDSQPEQAAGSRPSYAEQPPWVSSICESTASADVTTTAAAAAAAAAAARSPDDGSDSGLQSADSSSADMPLNPPVTECAARPCPAFDGEPMSTAAAVASDFQGKAEEQEEEKMEEEDKEEGAETREEEEEKDDNDEGAEQQHLFVCCACNALLSQPVLLEGCLHNCCSKCLDAIASSSSPETADGTDGGKRHRCPKCNLSSEVACGGASQPQNAYVASRVLSMRAVAGTATCDQCLDTNSGAATHLCHECNQFLCATCLHWHGKFNSRHSTTALSAFTVTAAVDGQDGSERPRVAQVCGQHKSAYSLYCSACDELKCMVCSKPCMEATHDLIVIGQSRASELSAVAAARVSESLQAIDERAQLVSAAVAAAAPAPSHAGRQPSAAAVQRRRIDAALSTDLETLRANRASAMELVARAHSLSEEAVRLAYAEFARSTAAGAITQQPATAQQRQQLRLLLRRLRQASSYCRSVLADGGEVGVLGQHKAMTHCMSTLRGDVDALLPPSLLPSQVAAPAPVALQEPRFVGRQLSEEQLERLLQQWIGVPQQQEEETTDAVTAVTGVSDVTRKLLGQPDQVSPTWAQRPGGEALSRTSRLRLLRDYDSAAETSASQGPLDDSATTVPALAASLAVAPPSSVPAGTGDADSDVTTVLRCCACGKAPQKPQLLGCLHSCCASCLPRIATAAAPAAGAAAEVPREACVTCPKCGVSCPTTSATANRLAADYMLLQRIAANQPLACEMCLVAGKSSVTAVHVCRDCSNQPLCDACLRRHSKFTKQHSVQAVSTLHADSSGGSGSGAVTNRAAGLLPSPWVVPAPLSTCEPHGTKCDLYCCTCEQFKCVKCSQPCLAARHGTAPLDGGGRVTEHAQAVCTRLDAELAEVDGKLASLAELADQDGRLDAALGADLLAVRRSAGALLTETDEAHEEARHAVLQAYESLKRQVPELAAAAGRLRPRLHQAAAYCRLLAASGDAVGVLEQRRAVGACLAALRADADAMPAAAVLTALKSGVIKQLDIDRQLIRQWIGLPRADADEPPNPERHVQQTQQQQPPEPSEQRPPDRAAAAAGGAAAGIPAASGNSQPSATAGTLEKPTVAKTPADVTAASGTASSTNVDNQAERRPALDAESSGGDDSKASLSGDDSEAGSSGGAEANSDDDDDADASFWHNNIVTGDSSRLQGLQFGVASGSFDVGEDVCVVAVLSGGSRIVVAGPQSGMAEYDVESGGQLSFWRPPQTAEGADDRIVTMHVIGTADEEDGGGDLLVVGLVDSLSVAVLRRIRLDDAEELWLEEQRLALRTAPWHLSAEGSLLAVAGAQETQQPGGSTSWSPGPYLDLMHRRSGAEVFSIQADYDVQSLTLTGSAVVTLSNNKLPAASDGSQAYVVEARSHTGEKLWRNDSGKACDICICPIGSILCVVDHGNHCIRALSSSDGSYVGDIIGGGDHDIRSPTSISFALSGQRVVLAVLSANHNVRLYNTTATSQP